jgi:alkylation response protein AidB-like acyl-CoA dehydrogenase
MAIKESVNRATKVDADRGHRLRAPPIAPRFASADAHEGMRAFMDKRPAVFTHAESIQANAQRPMALDIESFDILLPAVQRFVRERLVPAENYLEEHDEVPADIIEDMKAMGLFGLTVPEEYGGIGLSVSQEVQVNYELGRTAPAFRSVFGTNIGIGSQGILMDGTPEQKAEYLPRVASGELIMSFALTEPDAGTDAASLKTRADWKATTTCSTAPSASSPMRRAPAPSR